MLLWVNAFVVVNAIDVVNSIDVVLGKYSC